MDKLIKIVIALLIIGLLCMGAFFSYKFIFKNEKESSKNGNNITTSSDIKTDNEKEVNNIKKADETENKEEKKQEDDIIEFDNDEEEVPEYIKNLYYPENKNDISDFFGDNVYSIKEKKFYFYNYESKYENSSFDEIKLYEYDNSHSEYADIYYLNSAYTTDPLIYYTVEVTDSNGNNILKENSKENGICGGSISVIRIKKVDLNSKINITIFEQAEEILKKMSVQLDLSKDLEKKSKIDQSKNMIEKTFGDIKFKYVKHKNEYFGKSEHAYSKNLTGETASLPINTQYGNYVINEDNIDLYYVKNVNNLTLDKAFEYTKLIKNNMGEYGLSDLYGITIAQNGKLTQEIIVTFEEMIKLCQGKTITKDGNEYNMDLTSSSDIEKINKVSEVTIGNGIKAIQYEQGTNNLSYYYIFVHNDKIYTVKVPKTKRVNAQVQEFLKNIELVEK